jgi:hypothetical protein
VGCTANIHTQTPDKFYLVADTAFPQGAANVDGHIHALLKSGQRLLGIESQIAKHMASNHQLLSYCQTAEGEIMHSKDHSASCEFPLRSSTLDVEKLFGDMCACTQFMQTEGWFQPDQDSLCVTVAQDW